MFFVIVISVIVDFVLQHVRPCITSCKTAFSELEICITDSVTKGYFVKQGKTFLLLELTVTFWVSHAGAGRLLSQPSDFSPALDEQKQSSETEHCFPSSIAYEKAQNHYHPHSAFCPNRCNESGDDRQVSQNGMPFCTGCTLFGHILNLQGSKAPLDPSFHPPK